MVRSYSNLWPTVVSWQNLVTAYTRCRRRKRYKPEAIQFHFNWESHLLRLQRQLVECSYTPGVYRHFYIYDPKKRKISAAPFRDRVVHHAVVNVVEPLFERQFIVDSYACRRGKGTHRALDRAQEYLKRHRFVLKTDIVRFFPNIDHELLLDRLARTIRDRQLMNLIATIIASGEGVLRDEAGVSYFPGDDLFAALRPKGLPIGNLTSQFFSNVLLDAIDHRIKEDLRVPGYVRYADDFLLFGDSKEQLWFWRDQLAAALAGLRLRLHESKTQLRPTHAGVKFLGFVLRSAERRLQQSAVRRFNRRRRRMQRDFRQGARTTAEIRSSLQAWLAHISSANSEGIRRELWRRLIFRKDGENDD